MVLADQVSEFLIIAFFIDFYSYCYLFSVTSSYYHISSKIKTVIFLYNFFDRENH